MLIFVDSGLWVWDGLIIEAQDFPGATAQRRGKIMAFATNSERLALIKSSLAFNACPFVVRIRTWRGESEIACDDFEHAFDTAHDWKKRGAKYVEMFRVCEHDGSLYGGIGEI